MQYVVMKSNDIRRNLATEQYLMNSDQIKPPFMLFYIEEPCIIVGRNQNTFEEINQAYCEAHHVTVTRRLSGGGAMYQDLGNLCFSFVVPADEVEFGQFSELVKPVVDALHDLGATGAEVNGRNDLTIDGKKFSGNAMYTRNGKTFSHGTLMYDVNTDEVANALQVPADKIASKGIKSVRSRVTNLRPYLKPEYQSLTTAQFRDEIIKRIWQVDSIEAAQVNEYHLTPADEAAIDQIEAKTYKNWDWVYGRSPAFTIQKRRHFASGTIDIRYQVDHGEIKAVKIFGDFFGTQDVADLENALTGIAYDPTTIRTILQAFDLPSYFTGHTPEEVIELFAMQE